jgi:ribosomal protein S18 acetylase RimI-like enzyme
VTLRPVSLNHLDALRELGQQIWREHYVPIIGAEQVEHMVALRFAPEALLGYIGARDRWFKVLLLGEKMTGYTSYALDGAGGLKLEQLYIETHARGRGLGGTVLGQVESAARDRGCDRVWLTVNRHNASAITVYRHRGYEIERAAVFDIGGGFVMDDYVMTKAV